jgi:DUF4097 and DUF4098 domain-containing protein YvlB
MILATAAALATALTVGAAQAQPPTSRAPQTDQTVSAARGARLTLSNLAGEIVIRAWDKDAVRVQARHASRTKISIRTQPTGIAISASGSQGPPASVDYEINVPVWMPLNIEGTYTFISVEGSQAEVSAENVRGDIVIKGGSGSVTAQSIEGEVTVDGARGRINAGSVNEGIRITGASGDIVAETTNGSIALTRISSPHVEIATVNGDVTYEGGIADRGKYRFASHNGDIIMTLPDNVNATFVVRSYNGDFRSGFQVQGPPAAEVRRGRRVSYTLGNGSAEVEVETFGGDIRLRRAGSPETARDQNKDKNKDKHR